MELDVLDTPRLRLEPQAVAHAERLFRLFQDPELHRWTAKDAPQELEQFRQTYATLEARLSPDRREYWFNWVSFHKQTNDVVGKVELSILGDGGSPEGNRTRNSLGCANDPATGKPFPKKHRSTAAYARASITADHEELGDIEDVGVIASWRATCG